MPGPRPIALLFPGQGAQHVRMAAGLYGHVPTFTEVMDNAFELLGEQGERVRADWLSTGSPELFDDVTRAQPLLYAVDYALGDHAGRTARAQRRRDGRGGAGRCLRLRGRHAAHARSDQDLR